MIINNSFVKLVIVFFVVCQACTTNAATLPVCKKADVERELSDLFLAPQFEEFNKFYTFLNCRCSIDTNSLRKVVLEVLYNGAIE